MLDMLKKFEQVQELDLMIDKMLATKAEFPKRLQQYEQDVRSGHNKVSDLKRKLDEIEKTHRQQKGALELNEERSKRSQERLSGVKNNDEYQALQRELESLKKNTLAIYEQEKKVNEDISKIQNEIQSIENSIRTAEEKKSQEKGKIEQEDSGVTRELDSLKQRRNDAAQGIQAKYLAAYDKVRVTKGGVGVVPILNGVCKGCNMYIPPQLFVEIQRMTEIHTCPSCRRLLVFRDPRSAQQDDHTSSDERSSH